MDAVGLIDGKRYAIMTIKSSELPGQAQPADVIFVGTDDGERQPALRIVVGDEILIV